MYSTGHSAVTSLTRSDVVPFSSHGVELAIPHQCLANFQSECFSQQRTVRAEWRRIPELKRCIRVMHAPPHHKNVFLALMHLHSDNGPNLWRHSDQHSGDSLILIECLECPECHQSVLATRVSPECLQTDSTNQAPGSSLIHRVSPECLQREYWDNQLKWLVSPQAVKGIVNGYKTA